MYRLALRFWARVHHQGLHGHTHLINQRRRALILVITGLFRSACWLTLGVLYLSGVPFTHALFASVAFVALLSLYANAATDFGQACASLADLSASDAHHDAEYNRALMTLDINQLEQDIAQLAELHPGPVAKQLSDSICQRIKAAP